MWNLQITVLPALHTAREPDTYVLKFSFFNVTSNMHAPPSTDKAVHSPEEMSLEVQNTGISGPTK